VRLLTLTAGIALIAVAFGAGTRVADTREGLIAEVITLLAGVAGIGLVLFAVFARARPSSPVGVARPPAPVRSPSARDFAVGASGLALAAVLIGGLVITAGLQWAAWGTVLLLPMIAGSAFLCGRYLRSRGAEPRR
jgi:hypothetical protein